MIDNDPEAIRNRAENEARLAANASPPAIELKRKKFLRWNGDPPAPQITHWTKRGVFTIPACTPDKTTLVLFDKIELGFAANDPTSAARTLFGGGFDRELGFAASELLPPTLAGWNDLGG